MIWRSLLGASALTILVSAFAACGLSTGGIAPDTTGNGGAGTTTSTSTGLGGDIISGQATTSVTASSSSGSGMENCFNGKDDNGDMKIDCADPQCGGLVASCLDVPKDWTPVWVHDNVDPGSTPGTCPDGVTPEALLHKQPAGMPNCTGCSCMPDQGAKCSAPEITCWYYNTGCMSSMGDQGDKHTANDTNCITLNTPPGSNNGSCKLTAAPHPTGGSCAPMGNPMPTDPMWGSAMLVCNATSSTGGCQAGQACVSGQTPQGDMLCIRNDKGANCPAGWPTSIDAFTGGKDNRSCGACSCSLACSGGGYTAHDFDNCTNGDVAVTGNIGDCVTVLGDWDANKASLTPILGMPKAGACTSMPGGKVDGTGAVQICCK